MMKAYQSIYLIVYIFGLLFTSGCKEDEAPQALEERRTITIDLGIAMSRAPEDETADKPTDIQLWVFDQTGEKVFYKALNETSLSVSNGFITIAEQEIPIKANVKDLHFHVVLNSQNATFTPTLDENTSESSIQGATFTSLHTNLTDNQVPMYGYAVKENISLNNRYAISIDATRAVGKLELYFTKTSADAYLKINSIKLEQVPDKGYLASKTSMPADISYTNPDGLFFESTTEVIGTFLSSDVLIGDFSDYASNFKQLDLPNPYLLENLNGTTWTQEEGKDDTYPDDITDPNTRYKLIVNYQTSATSTTTQTKEIYLPRFERNNLYKIFARVKDDGLSLALQVMPWEKEEWTVEWSNSYQFTCTVGKETITEGDETYYPITYTATNDPSQTNDIFITFQLTEPIGTRWVASLDNGQDFFFCDPNSDNPSIDDHYVPGGYAGDSPITIRIKAIGENNKESTQQVSIAIRVLSPEGTWNRLIIDEEKQTGGAEDYILIKQVAD